MNSVAAIRPPVDFVNASHTLASFGDHKPCTLRVPTLVANEVEFAIHRVHEIDDALPLFRVSTPLNPAGALSCELSESAK